MRGTTFTALVLAGTLSIAAAQAVNVSGVAAVGYSHISSPGIGVYSAGGGVLFAFRNPGFQTQVSGADEHMSLNGVTVDVAHVSGDAFWRDRMGTIGLSLSYHLVSAGFNLQGVSTSGSASAESFGAFGEYYLNRSLTLRLKGGAFTGDFKGAYGAVGAAYYPKPNMSLSVDYNYLSVNHGGHSSTPGVTFEVLPYEPLPVTVAVNYAHASGGGTKADSVGIALVWHIGETGSDLKTMDRTGPIQWNGALPL